MTSSRPVMNTNSNGAMNRDIPTYTNVDWDNRESVHARFTLLNIQGLVTKFTNKLHSQELKTVFSNSDFVLFVET